MIQIQPPADTVPEVLELAAEYVRQGWIQGSMWEFVDGKVVGCCASGALCLAAYGIPGRSVHRLDLEIAAEEVLGLHLGWIECIPIWNDHPGQTQENVADTMLSVAKDLRNKGAAA